MKNIEKWQKTEKVIFNLSKDTYNDMDFKELRRRLITKPNIDTKNINPEYDNVSIVIKSASLRFFSDKLGSYMEALFKKRMQLNVVPTCFLIQLYNEQLGASNKEARELYIPFELKSFWKMEKAKDLVGDLAKIIWEQKCILQNIEDECTLAEQKSKINDILELVNSLEIQSPKNGKTEIYFSDSKFIVNTKNVKLDIIPLCKMLVKYYVQFVTFTDEAYESLNTYLSKQRIYKCRCNMEEFMEKYFTSCIKY